MKSTSGGKYHVLLIGIDDYSVKPLDGCVNDIDAIQRRLLGERAQISKGRITRLVSPRPECKHEEIIDSRPATFANIYAALEHLGSRDVEDGDRVFIYYSGHGSRVRVDSSAGTLFREALVPVDFNARLGDPRMLFDFEVNRLLAAVAARTGAVTVILDCCHSAGATREASQTQTTPRSLDLASDAGLPAPIALQLEQDRSAVASSRGIRGNVDDCQIIAACLDHELAGESSRAGDRSHGLLTRALLDQLDAVAETSSLLEIPWRRVWQGLRAAVETANPDQHVWMTGSEARAIIGGPHVDGDPGLTIRRTRSDAYTIDAGTMVGVSNGAKVAVYGPLPLRFPPLGVRQGDALLSDVLLEVTAAGRANAEARALGSPFDVPPGARGRIVEPGAADRLCCAVVPADEAVMGALAKSPLLDVVDEGCAQAVLRKEDGTWTLVDDVHGAKPDYPVLCRFGPDQLDAAAPLMEQYFYYRLPLRMATLSKDLPGALLITVLACPGPQPLAAAQADGIGLMEAASDGRFAYDLRSGDRIAFRVDNRSSARLKVTLLNAAASGRVELLGEQVIEPRAYAVFWRANTRGEPFSATVPAGASQGIDRLVAIGTDEFGGDLRHLRVDSTFAEVLTRHRSGITKDFFGDVARGRPLVELWSAHQVVVRCGH